METIFVLMYLNSTAEVQLVAIEQITEAINNSLIVKSTEKIEYDGKLDKKGSTQVLQSELGDIRICSQSFFIFGRNERWEQWVGEEKNRI